MFEIIYIVNLLSKKRISINPVNSVWEYVSQDPHHQIYQILISANLGKKKCCFNFHFKFNHLFI